MPPPYSVAREIPTSLGIKPLSSDLVERAQSGDREAFDTLATAAYDRLYAVAHRMLRDGQAAEDAVQEALIKAWRDLRSLRELDRFDAWLHRLLVRSCYDQSRKRRRFSVEIADLSVDRSDPADEYARVADRDELERAFLHLSMEHRAVLVLTHYVGLPAPDVARILQIPTGTVYSRLHYAVRTMRTAIVGVPSVTAVPEHGR
jgi:RNA polymerase sigma-70 factor (ECF subfamily)